MGAGHIWNMVAFLQEMPEMDAGEYQAMVANSGGHDHGGGETGGHGHGANEADDHHDGAAVEHGHEQSGAAAGIPHAHGTDSVDSHQLPEENANSNRDEVAADPKADNPAAAESHDEHTHDH